MLALILLLLGACAHRDYLREPRGFCREFAGPTVDREQLRVAVCTVPR